MLARKSGTGSTRAASRPTISMHVPGASSPRRSSRPGLRTQTIRSSVVPAEQRPDDSRRRDICLDPPSEAEVWAKLPKASKDNPLNHEVQRNNVRIAIEKIAHKVDPVKVYPLAGACQLVHCHYKCTVSYDELSWSDYPIPFKHVAHKVEVVYIDKDHLRRARRRGRQPVSRGRPARAGRRRLASSPRARSSRSASRATPRSRPRRSRPSCSVRSASPSTSRRSTPTSRP